MSTIHHNKLVRDRIPEIIEAGGKSCEYKLLNEQEYLLLLLKQPL